MIRFRKAPAVPLQQARRREYLEPQACDSTGHGVQQLFLHKREINFLQTPPVLFWLFFAIRQTWKVSPNPHDVVSYKYRYLKTSDSGVSKKPFNLYASMSLFGMLYPVCFEYAEMVRFYHSVYRIVYHPQVRCISWCPASHRSHVSYCSKIRLPGGFVVISFQCIQPAQFQ